MLLNLFQESKIIDFHVAQKQTETNYFLERKEYFREEYDTHDTMLTHDTSQPVTQQQVYIISNKYLKKNVKTLVRPKV